MTVIELKEQLIGKINNINSEESLKQLLINVAFYEDVDQIYVMSEGEIQAVEEGMAQLDRGEWISNEEVSKPVEQWLKK